MSLAQQVFKINDKGEYTIDMDGEVTETQHAAMTALIEFIQSFDDREISIGCNFDPVMGGLRIVYMHLGKINIFGFSGEDEEILIIATAQHVADCSQAPNCFRDQCESLKRLLTTC